MENPAQPSRTAITTALMRSRHTRRDPHRVLDDPWGERLVPERARTAIAERALSQMPPDQRAAAQAAGAPAIADAALRANPAYANVITRSRYAEDALHEAFANGVRQYVLVGAGLDSYALRVPPQCAGLRIFEVDHPATQGFKLARIRECNIAVDAAAVRFAAADLSHEDLHGVLLRAGFDPGAPAFFSWLGVTMYLTRESNLAALRGIAACGAPGSELVFTYLDAAAFDLDPSAPGNRFAWMRQAVAAIGEPFLSGFDPAMLAKDLSECGFELLQDLSDAQLVQRFDPQGINGWRAGGYSRIARARRGAA